jgi:hypothetical protein
MTARLPDSHNRAIKVKPAPGRKGRASVLSGGVVGVTIGDVAASTAPVKGEK